ncbi:MAG: DUF6600 domain-containing protein [Pseudomonadota bacterium]
MNRQVVGLVALLGLAFVARTLPAQAQDGNSWFEEPPAESPIAPDSAPPGPAPSAPGPQAPYDTPPAPGPQAPYDTPPASGPQAPAQPDNVPETDPRAMTEFRSTLDPYGSWVNDPTYGTVWVPNQDVVGSDFAPYVTSGHWALTDDNDWIWQSDYPFGGVVFHYGRWVWLPGTGWAWVAGTRYANAWVNWRVSDDNYGYIGWAPMAPAWGWYGGFAIGLGWYPPTAYVFCPTRYAFSYHVHSYVVHDRYVVHDVAAHTHNYSDGRGHVAARPHVLPANSAPPRGPSMQNAHIPPSATPSSRVPMRSAYAGARAMPAMPYGADGSRRTFSSGSRPLVPSAYAGARLGSSSSYRAPSSYANPSMYARPRTAYGAPLGGAYRPATTLSGRTFTAPPTQSGSPGATRYSAPSMRTPSFSAPSRSYSAPSYSAPSRSYSAPSFSAPSRSYSAPSAPSFSAPSRSYSAPSFHSAPSSHAAPSSAGSHSFHSPSRR